MIAAIILGGILFIVLHCVICSEFRLIAEVKGHPEEKYFWYCFFFGIAGFLAVIALPDREAPTQSVRVVNFPEIPVAPAAPVAVTTEVPKLRPEQAKPGETTNAVRMENGDWKCPNCGSRNRSSRVKCFECGISVTFEGE